MSRTHWIYWVEQQRDGDTWMRVIGSQGNRSYALGWLHGLGSFYPRPAYRCRRQDSFSKRVEVVELQGGADAPKPNGMRVN